MCRYCHQGTVTKFAISILTWRSTETLNSPPPQHPYWWFCDPLPNAFCKSSKRMSFLAIRCISRSRYDWPANHGASINGSPSIRSEASLCPVLPAEEDAKENEELDDTLELDPNDASEHVVRVDLEEVLPRVELLLHRVSKFLDMKRIHICMLAACNRDMKNVWAMRLVSIAGGVHPRI